MTTPKTLERLVTLYRKAKVDLYRSSNQRLLDVVEYEENLLTNLQALAAKIDGDSEEWATSPEFVGSYTLAPELIITQPDASDTGDVLWSNAMEAWNRTFAERDPAARFRVMSRCSIDLHVFSSYWTNVVGEKLEAQLGNEALGNRIRRDSFGHVNEMALGTFRYYADQYQRWRDGGLEAMTDGLLRGKSIIALTADVSSFYHKLTPQFLANDYFLEDVLNVQLSPHQEKINRLFVSALTGWANRVSSETGWTTRGLPVGLPASAIVANLALIELDRVAIEEFKPIYYARYVDDIILVIESHAGLASRLSVWSWLVYRSRKLLDFDPHEAENAAGAPVRFSPHYLADSEIKFENTKNKIFHLAGASGLGMVRSIKNTIDQRSSEWRSFTAVSQDPSHIAGNLSTISQEDGEPATTLRDADQLSTRRSDFAIMLREFEAYERDLDIESWAKQRSTFFESN